MKDVKQCTVLLLMLPVLLTGCRHGSLPKEVVRTVKLTEATGCEGERSISFPGKLKASSEANLAFRISGPIRRFPSPSDSRYAKEKRSPGWIRATMPCNWRLPKRNTNR